MAELPTPSLFSEARTLADRAFEWLEAAIVKGEIAAETHIDEGALARTLGISRGPVREAIRRLEGKKLVERVPHIGARVVAPSLSGMLDLFEVREALEGLACRLAAERMSDAEIAELRVLLDTHAHEDSVRAGEHYFQRPGNDDFHFRIIKGSGNAKLIQYLIDDIYHLMRIYRYRTSSRPGRTRVSLDEHLRIVDALASRDPDEAEREMRRHVAHARELLSQEIVEPSAEAPASRLAIGRERTASSHLKTDRSR